LVTRHTSTVLAAPAKRASKSVAKPFAINK
jgi:hypothetical protein